MPTFGYTGESTSKTVPTDNRIAGSLFLSFPEDGIGESITIYVNVDTEAHEMKCAIYTSAGSLVANAVTEEKTIAVASWHWETFNFLDPKPSLVGGTDYVLVAWSKDRGGQARLGGRAGATGQHKQQFQTYNSFPSSVTWTSYNNEFGIYCTYTVGGVTYEISVDAVVKASAPLATQTTYNVEKDASISSSGLVASESVYNVLKDAIIKGDATVETFIEKIVEVVASVSVSATPELQSIFNVLKNAEIKVSAAYTLELLFNIYEDVTVYATAIPEVSIGVVKKTKIFLMIGNIAIQLSGD